MKAKSKSTPRSVRVGALIRRELSEIVRTEVKDPALAAALWSLTLTEVTVTSDLAHAKVYYTVLEGVEKHPELPKALAASKGILRAHLSRRMSLHHVPELHFLYDDSVERGARLTKLIEYAVKSDQQT